MKRLLFLALALIGYCVCAPSQAQTYPVGVSSDGVTVGHCAKWVTGNILGDVVCGSGSTITVQPSGDMSGATDYAALNTAIPVGARVSITGISPTGYNGVYTVTASSTTSVSYANATTTTYVSGGAMVRVIEGFKLQNYNPARLKVTFAGQLEAYGGELATAERAVISNGSGVLSASTIGTDYDSSGSGKLVIGTDVTQNNWCYVTLYETPSGAASEKPIGSVSIDLSGPVEEIYRYQ